MKKYRIELSPEAAEDLTKLHDSITESLDGHWADLVVFRIKENISRLAISPHSCRMLDGVSNLRRIKSGKYVAIFRIFENERKVIILHVFYARRDYLSILKNEQQ